jgi:hypothetical protein
MNNAIRLSLCALLIILAGQAFSTSLDVVLDNTLYVRKNLLDSSASPVTYAGGYNASLEKIGSTNLSLFSDFGLANTFLDSTHKKFEFRTLYLDAPVIPNFDAKIGRQLMCDLILKNVCLDGARLEYDLADRAKFHGYLAEPVPSRYGKPLVNHDLSLLQGGLGADVAVHPTTWIGVQAADITYSSDTAGQIPVGGYVDSRISKNLGVKADAEYDLAAEKMLQYSIDVNGRPTPHVQWRAYVLGENQAIDSTNAYERLVLGNYADVGLQLGYNDHRTFVRGYYSLRALENGSDQLAGISASALGLFLDLEGGAGVSGSSVKMSAAYARDLLESLRCGAGASYYIFKLSQNPSQEHSFTARAYANWTIPAAGFVVAPELQYLTNQYYHRDVRFQLNVQYQFLAFWKSR